LEIEGGKDITIIDNVVDISLSEDINVEYTTVGNVTHGDTIAKGSSLTEVLKQLLQKVSDVKVVSEPSITVSSSKNVLFPYNQDFETTLTATFKPV
jgi:type II secretory pathway component GspD/PulD (secretin)